VTSALSATGAVNFYNNYGTVDLVVDINGYYTPATSGGAGPAGPTGLTGSPTAMAATFQVGTRCRESTG
jgi:hypothetical protein